MNSYLIRKMKLVTPKLFTNNFMTRKPLILQPISRSTLSF